MTDPIHQSAAPAFDASNSLAPSRGLTGATRSARPMPWRAALELVSMIVLAIAAILAALAQARATDGAAQAQFAPSVAPSHVAAPYVTPAEMRSGSLLLRADAGRNVEAPLLATDIDVTVSGPTARARVTQLFHNPTDHWVEAVYVYPLPEGGAVDTLKMVVGERIIVGDVMERKTAQAIYEKAKAAGQKAALMEQERPNIFTNSVANIAPAKACWCRSSTRSRCISRATNIRCASRWSSRRATTRSNTP